MSLRFNHSISKVQSSLLESAPTSNDIKDVWNNISKEDILRQNLHCNFMGNSLNPSNTTSSTWQSDSERSASPQQTRHQIQLETAFSHPAVETVHIGQSYSTVPYPTPSVVEEKTRAEQQLEAQIEKVSFNFTPIRLFSSQCE